MLWNSFVWPLSLLISSVVYVLSRMWTLTYLAQRESYQLTGYRRNHLALVFRTPDLYVVLAAVLDVIFGAIHQGWVILLISLVVILLGALVHRNRRRKTYKKPLVWTARAKRLATMYVVISVVLTLILLMVLPTLAGIVPAISVYIMFLALLVTKPIERGVQNGFKKQAQARLSELRQKSGLRVIGVTGSYGKTSVKFILGTILSEKYKTYVTPDSFNTPMGLCRVVNENRLTVEHEVFVAEMGARYRNDIRELVNLVHPDHGIITAVGPAHLETMGPIENIANTKFDLARGVPPEGIVVVNGDNRICRNTAATLGRTVFLYGTEGNLNLSAVAEDIRIVGAETEFTLVIDGDGAVTCRTRLLGRHNVLNIVGAALMARKLGLSLDEIRRGVSKIQPVEHRLQLMDPKTGVLIIDDAFNSNPEGARMALEVLGQFEGRRKWIITPGMVEMGTQQHEVNRTFGQQIADVSDFAILVSKVNSSAMQQGLRDAGFPEERMYVVGSLNEATAIFTSQARPGDVVLFENDLADHLEQTS